MDCTCLVSRLSPYYFAGVCLTPVESSNSEEKERGDKNQPPPLPPQYSGLLEEVKKAEKEANEDPTSRQIERIYR